MTANQINARAVDEEIRHNQAVEGETSRHNYAMEDIETRRNNITEDYQREKLRIDEAYNDKYIEYLNASNEQKVELEKQLNEIKAEQNQIDKDYKQRLTWLEQERNSITEAYNEGMLEKYGIDQEIESRRVEYQKYATDMEYAYKYEALDLARAEYEQKVWKEQQDLLMRSRELGNAEWNLNLKRQELELSQSQFQFQQEMWDTNKLYVESQTSFMKSNTVMNYGRTIDLFNPFRLRPEAAQLLNNAINLAF